MLRAFAVQHVRMLSHTIRTTRETFGEDSEHGQRVAMRTRMREAHK